jgi:hypothetical protein
MAVCFTASSEFRSGNLFTVSQLWEDHQVHLPFVLSLREAWNVNVLCTLQQWCSNFLSSRTPRSNISSALRRQNCWCIIQVRLYNLHLKKITYLHLSRNIFPQFCISRKICSRTPRGRHTLLRLKTTVLEQHVFMYNAYVKYGSARNCQQKFRRKFLDERVPKQTYNPQFGE